MKVFLLGFVLLLGAADNAGGCGGNPNYIGVQQYGAVTGRVLDATNNRPIPSALVSVGSLYTGYADQQGAFTLTTIPAGRQEVTASAPGYVRASVQVRVIKAQTATADYIRLIPLTGGSTVAPPATPTPSPEPSSSAEPSPNPSSTPAPQASATPGR